MVTPLSADQTGRYFGIGAGGDEEGQESEESESGDEDERDGREL